MTSVTECVFVEVNQLVDMLQFKVNKNNVLVRLSLSVILLYNKTYPHVKICVVVDETPHSS